MGAARCQAWGRALLLGNAKLAAVGWLDARCVLAIALALQGWVAEGMGRISVWEARVAVEITIGALRTVSTLMVFISVGCEACEVMECTCGWVPAHDI